MFYGQTYSIHQLDYKEQEMCYNISSCSHSTSTYFDQGFFLKQDTFSIQYIIMARKYDIEIHYY